MTWSFVIVSLCHIQEHKLHRLPNNTHFIFISSEDAHVNRQNSIFELVNFISLFTYIFQSGHRANTILRVATLFPINIALIIQAYFRILNERKINSIPTNVNSIHFATIHYYTVRTYTLFSTYFDFIMTLTFPISSNCNNRKPVNMSTLFLRKRRLFPNYPNSIDFNSCS